MGGRSADETERGDPFERELIRTLPERDALDRRRYDRRTSELAPLERIGAADPVMADETKPSGSNRNLLEINRTPAGPLRLVGEIDRATSPKLEQAIASWPAQGDVELDLSEVRFIDVGGARLLRLAAAELARKGRTLRLLAPPGTIARSIELLGLERCDGVAIEPGHPKAGSR